MTSNAFNDGHGFESSLAKVNAIYEQRGLATVCKVEPPVKSFGHGITHRTIYLPNPFVDFCGSWTERGGRAMHFEAKSTSEPALPCQAKGGFSQSQRDSMARWRTAGAVTFLLWEMHGQTRFWTYDMVQAGLQDRASLVWADGHVVGAGKGWLFIDWLATVRQFEKYL